MHSIPQPHITAFAISRLRVPCASWKGCLRIAQLADRPTAWLFKIKASLVWIWSIVASKNLRIGAPLCVDAGVATCAFCFAIALLLLLRVGYAEAFLIRWRASIAVTV